MRDKKNPSAVLRLEDGIEFRGVAFGAARSTSGEVVFNTGLVGYPESLTDPSYRGQILVLTYPLVGNYGVPGTSGDEVDRFFESHELQISGLIVSSICQDYSHWNAVQSLPAWLNRYDIPAISGIDTRSLTKRLREKGTMLGKILHGEEDVRQFNPEKHNLVSKVSCEKTHKYGAGKKNVVLIDCGCKNNIIHSLVNRGVSVTRVPWNFDFTTIDYDGLFISNGPGDPTQCVETIQNLKKALEKKKPIFGICLGNQLLALAAGADTYKLKYGHRSQNQPCIDVFTKRCFITSQNHGYAVDRDTLPPDWKLWFKNANDGTNEGIRHETLPFMSVQFHPEARPGPTDTKHLFDEFIGML